MTTAYPLAWPYGRPRSNYPVASRFGTRTVDQCTKMLVHEIKLLGGSDVVLSTNIRLRNDGYPHSSQRPPEDKGVAVYFTYKKRQMCFACDRWDKIQDNIYAIAMTIEALRGIERWGSGSMVEQAFTGFVALPAPKSPHDILGVQPNATEDEIEHAYKFKAMVRHPDRGGSHELMAELNAARTQLKAKL